MEIGVGTFYNKRWTSQVCELDAAGNSIVSQFIWIGDRPSNPTAPIIPLPPNIPNIPNIQAPPAIKC